MRIDSMQHVAPKGLVETDPLLGDLTKRTSQRLAEYQAQQMRSKTAFQRAVLKAAGFGRAVDRLV
jgi:hypothetical protein